MDNQWLMDLKGVMGCNAYPIWMQKKSKFRGETGKDVGKKIMVSIDSVARRGNFTPN